MKKLAYGCKYATFCITRGDDGCIDCHKTVIFAVYSV